MIEMYIDGASRGNPGMAASGFVVLGSDGNEVYRHGRALGRRTNNFAEYTALIDALRYVFEESEKGSSNHAAGYMEDVVVFSDSELLVRQMNGHYRVRSSLLKPLYREAKSIIKKMSNVRIEHVRRERNKTADRIVNMVLDGESIPGNGNDAGCA